VVDGFEKGNRVTDSEGILTLYRDRKVAYAELHQKMRMIGDIYNGRAKVPLPDMDRDEMPAVPNLLAQGVDQMAGRITSVMPVPAFSSEKPGVRRYDRRASDASRTITGWWQSDRFRLKQTQRGRRIIAYGMAPVVIEWNYEEHRPTWRVRHPLETLPSADLEPGQVRPQNCIFTYRRTVGWLCANGYEMHARKLVGKTQWNRDTRVTMLEYIDEEHTVLMAAGHFSRFEYATDGLSGEMSAIVLTDYPNLCGDDSPVVIPTRLTLDSMTGQFDTMAGMYYQQAKLMALETIAVEKDIFPDTWLIGRPNETPRITEGPHDGRTGLVNVATGGDIKLIQSSPGYMTQQTIDRIERSQRVTAGIPSEFGGESGTNIRTGRRGDAVMSAVIDFPVSEAQDVFAAALEEENETAIKLAKRIDGSAKRTIYVGIGNNRKPVTYTANDTFAVDEHVVAFPVSGTDMNSLIIGIGQRVGLGTMSKETAQHLDPFIDSPESEHDAIIAESLEQALLGSIQQQASTGAIPPLTLAKVMNLVRSDKMELAEALNKVTEDALAEKKAQEAQQGMDPNAAMTPDQAAADPTVAAMAGAVPPTDQTMPGMKGLGDMLGQLRRPAMTIQPMRGVSQGAM
jgi:hypothetical protein